MKFQQIRPEELSRNPFVMIGEEWMLITAKKEGKVNTMTASWGGLGVMWGKDVAFIAVRPQRYTKELIDASDTVSLSVLGPAYRKTLTYLGSTSGRDEDKIAKAHLTVVHEGETPYFAEAETVLIGRKLYAQTYRPECFIDKSCDTGFYPEKDYHTLYILEIEKVLQQMA